MKKFLFTILALAALLCSAHSRAQEMRQRTIAGKTYYVYTVKDSDTLDGLTGKLGMTRAEIIRFNPSASDGLIAGQWLIFPAGEYSGANLTESEAKEAQPSSAENDKGYTTYTVRNNETIFGVAHRFGISPEQLVSLNPQAASGVHQGMVLKVPAGSDVAPVSQPAPAPEVIAVISTDSAPAEVPESKKAKQSATDSVRITLALPLMSETERVSKSANNFNEFYRGFLVGLQSVAAGEAESASEAAPVSISVIDTSVSPLTSDLISGADMVIVGEEDEDISHAARIADDGTVVLNVFNLRNDLYLSHPNVLNTNVNQNRMYERAIAYVAEQFAGFTPVILNREGSRAEKSGFVDDLRKSVIDAGGNVIDITYSGKLSEDDLTSLSPTEKYLFIPTSGALGDFNLFAPAIKKLRDEAARPDMIALFGYPDWIAFRGDARNLLGRLRASYYSRFADIEGNAEASKALDAYTAWYGVAATDGIPNQALLGYDTARYILSGLRGSTRPLDMMTSTECVTGVQSAFRPAKAGGDASGYINDAVFIITFNSDGTTKSIVK